MRSSGTTSLFSESSDIGPQPFSFAASALIHGLAIAIGWFAIAYTPHVTHVVTERYSVRNLDLHVPDLDRLVADARNQVPAPKPAPRLPAPPSSGSPAPAVSTPPQTAPAKLGPQTLVQPDLPKPIQLSQEVPLPQIVIWSPPKVQVKHVTPPQPQKLTASDVKPSVETPNQEMNLADVNVSSTFHPSAKNIVPPSTTSPVAVHAPVEVQMPPATVSQSTLQPTPVAILSLSDLRAKDQSVTLPPVSETKASNTQGAGPQNPAQKTAPAATTSNAKSEGTGAGQGPPTKTNSPGSGSGQGPVAKIAPGSSPGAGSSGSANSNGNPGPDQPAMAGATLLTVPRDGHFGSVIVGDSLQDQYPEIADIWSGRLTYTAYLHVGLAKSWILQYSLPRSTEAASAGTVARLDAPWPFSIVRPNLEPGSVDADALMVHGFVNQSGRFETLTILFPEGFPRAQFVLAALQQWQFRPAAQDGRPAKVEVLLIIPEEYE